MHFKMLGRAMGTKVAPNYATLVLEEMETPLRRLLYHMEQIRRSTNKIYL